MTALSLSQSDLPEEIEKAIAEVVATQRVFVSLCRHPLNREAWQASLACSDALEALTAAILSRLASAERCCDSYARENQQLCDKADAALARVERMEKALEDLKDAFHEDSDAYAKISAALTSPAATEEG